MSIRRWRYLPALSVGGVLLILACGGFSKELDQARKLADMGQVDLAVKKVEEIMADNPEYAPAYETLGDIHVKAALANPREGVEHAKAAAASLEGAIKLSDDEDGTMRAKRALALLLSGDRTAGTELALEAWRCCQNTAVLALSDDRSVHREVLEAISWDLGDWNRLPAFVNSKVDSRSRYITKRDGAAVVSVEDGAETRRISPFSSGRANAQSGGFLTFVDQSYPVPVTRQGYVTANSCRTRARAGQPCEAGRTIRGSSPYIYSGPCWWTACNKGEQASDRVDLRNYQRNSATCVGGAIAHKSDFTGEETCKVTYSVMQAPTRKISVEDVWLLPAEDGFRSMQRELQLASDAGLFEIADHIASGEFAIGLPRPLLGWLLDGVKGVSTLTVEEQGVVETVEVSVGTLTFTDGMLTAFEPASSQVLEETYEEARASKRSECPSNLDGIKTAEIAYEAAFDRYTAAERTPRELPDENEVVWPRPAHDFDVLGWEPRGDVRGVYWVELKSGGADFEAHALCDVDGDGQAAHYVATRTTSATLVTGNDVF
jgi:hypothetical protein